MEKLKLTDRIVVEIKSDGEHEQKTNPEYIAEQLFMIASAIKDGIKGDCENDEYTGDDGQQHTTEVLWEYECPEYGGFKIVSNKSLISQYYYQSELTPRIISEELADEIRKFNDDYEENEQEVGEDIDTKTNYLCDAVRLLSQVEQETTIYI